MIKFSRLSSPVLRRGKRFAIVVGANDGTIAGRYQTYLLIGGLVYVTYNFFHTDAYCRNLGERSKTRFFPGVLYTYGGPYFRGSTGYSFPGAGNTSGRKHALRE